MTRIHPLRSLLSLVLFAAVLAAQEAPTTVGYERDLRPLITEHCTDCHSGEDAEASLDLESLKWMKPGVADLGQMRRVRDQLLAGTMPPPEMEGPGDAEKRAALTWLGTAIAWGSSKIPADAGRVTLRRLSRYEYDATCRDLLGVTTRESAKFPGDDLGYGFDNIGDALSFSTLHFEKYAAAAEDLAARALPDDEVPGGEIRRFESEGLECSLGDKAQRGDHTALYSRGTVTLTLKLPRRGRYRISVLAWGDQAGKDPARMRLDLGPTTLKRFDVAETAKKPGVHRHELEVDGGRQSFSLSFVNDYYNPKAKKRQDRDRNLHIDWIEIQGPLDPAAMTRAQQWILGADPQRGSASSRRRAMLREMLKRAWRRPARSNELRRYGRLVEKAIKDGSSERAALRLALEGMLVSPGFLFRTEPRTKSKDDFETLGDYELASRLSYFLWSSLPDERLFALAQKQRLRRPHTLEAEARRLLEDPRSRALSENFAAQWLELRSLGDHTPDPERFPTADRALLADMGEETRLFFDHLLRSRAPLSELIDAPYSFLNPRLAEHYGLPALEGDHFRRVSLASSKRRGLLSQASFLSVTSNPTRTSPVKRGKWILDNLLDRSPPPPPPDAGGFPPGVEDAASLREAMMRHREDPNCSSCHVRLDPLGLALERFDAIGRLRLDPKIDTSSELPDGRKLKGAEDLRRVIAGDPSFRRCVLEKLFIYAVGRGPTLADELALDRCLMTLPDSASLQDLILGIVRMEAFRMRRVEN